MLPEDIFQTEASEHWHYLWLIHFQGEGWAYVTGALEKLESGVKSEWQAYLPRSLLKVGHMKIIF